MAELYVVEGPGGIGDVWQCPHCSRMYTMKDERGQEIEAPRICRRCNSPMDAVAGAKFTDQLAVQEAVALPQRRLVKI